MDHEASRTGTRMTHRLATNNPAAHLSGILNVDKPLGMTSHDVVDAVRRFTSQRRVGHAGTLDPAASGVLLVCLGQATRIAEFLMDSTKLYRAVVRFGAVSTTDDREGTITPSGAPAAELTLDRIVAATARFIGDVEQVPPAYSAIKVQGKPLYRAARAGAPIEAKPRIVHIERIDLISWLAPDLTIDVTCSKGTYIRALARDLGQALGSGAYLQALRRLASGPFTVDTSWSLEEIERACARGELQRLLQPLDLAVRAWPAFSLAPEDVLAIRQGRPWSGSPGRAGDVARAYAASTGHLVALLKHRGPDVGWQPDKVFAEDCDGVG